jgi:uncharacterized protein (TIGR02284 family)
MRQQVFREVEVLNDLLEITLDSVSGLHAVAAEARSADVQRQFQRRAKDRQQVAFRLAEAVQSLGGEPARGSGEASPARVFPNLRDKLMAGDEAGLKEVARGEHFLRSRYMEVLEGSRLSARGRDAVCAAYGSVWAGEHAVRGSGSEPGLAPRLA